MSSPLQTLINHQLLPQTTPKEALTVSDDTLTFHLPIKHIKKRIQALFPHHTIKQSIQSYAAKLKPNPSIKNILAIASGKGGVGKSTLTFAMAHALSHMGARVGVLDADIYGPSQTLLFDINTKPEITEDNYFLPFKRNAIEVMSIGVLAKSDKALMWRGPMISQALTQLYQKTQWGELDYLLIDLPPGTGDISLTLLQKIPTTAGILINYPHILAQIDVDRCESLFSHLEVPILAKIMNMAKTTCPNCQHEISPPIDHKDHFIVPVLEALQTLEPSAHPEIIALCTNILIKLLTYPQTEINPFDNIPVSFK